MSGSKIYTYLFNFLQRIVFVLPRMLVEMLVECVLKSVDVFFFCDVAGKIIP